MTLWIMRNPERIREKMEETKDSEQTGWVSHAESSAGELRN